MKNTCFIIMISCCLSNYAGAQKVDGDYLIDSIKKEVTRLFIKEGFLDSQRVNNSRDYVYVAEIKEKRSIGYDLHGIYRIGLYQSHSPEFILIKQADKFTIYGSGAKEIISLFSAIVEYCETSKIEPEEELLYLKEVIQLYNYSQVINREVKKK